MSYRIAPIGGTDLLLLRMKNLLVDEGWSEAQVFDKLDAIAAAHTAGSKPSGAVRLKPTPNGFQRFGVRIGPHLMTYHVRPPDLLAVDRIRLSE
ncbi:hypothetical protein N1F89_19950 [Aquibium sp. A9E412]|uniref:hypothetical protein n=1 Tax=Aquibium sp. A9E412 TaxID=2976767 RepID=UPI0025B0C7B9|nr:hypothetical protein [Aquibium sp. A9E412]MDN2568504.1 hypothetical protein [Aquibium sp. A9E412]